MSTPTYDNERLFASGPARCRPGGAALRFAEHQPLHADGSHVHAQGRAARDIAQTGTLFADTPTALRRQAEAIEAYVDGRGRELVDELGQAWPNAVMLAFEPGEPQRLGVRWKLEYRITYRQVRP